jgi:flagellar hook assembly protein FlgD
LIAYQIPAAGRVKLEVFNVIGKQVRVLVDRNQPAGSYAAEWEGRSSEGNDLTSGIYFVRLTADGTGGRTFTSIIKTILMR